MLECFFSGGTSIRMLRFFALGFSQLEESWKEEVKKNG